MISFSLLTLALAPFAYAQSSASASAPPPLPTALPSGTHAVAVGRSDRVFTPNSITVPVGDTVEFFFYPQAHGVVEATFENPCHPSNGSAFSSGLVPVTSGIGSQSFKVVVNESSPIWFYCPQTFFSHCQSGMVGVINPPTSGPKTLAAFAKAAKLVNGNSTMPAQVQGGVLGPADINSATTTITATASATTSSGSSSASASSSLGSASGNSSSASASGSGVSSPSPSITLFTGAAAPIPMAASSSIFSAFLALLGVFFGL